MKKTNRGHEERPADKREEETDTADNQKALTGGAAVADEQQEASALDGGSSLDHLDGTGESETVDTESGSDDETAPSVTEAETEL